MGACPLIKLCKCGEGVVCLFCIQLTFAAIAIAIGIIYALWPKKIINLQSAMYRPFNWKLEPISMEKEIRNTRIMGIFMLILGLAALTYIILSSVI